MIVALRRWATALAVAAFAVAAIEMGFVFAVLPAASSDGIGALDTFLLVVATYGLCGLPFALIGAVAERRGIRVPLPEPASLVACSIGAVVAVLPLRRLNRFLAKPDIEFPARVDLLETLLALVWVAVVLGLTVGAIRPAVGRLLRGAPTVGRPTPITLTVLVGVAFLGMFVGHALLSPMHQNHLSGAAGLGALLALLLAIRLSGIGRDRRVSRGLATSLAIAIPFGWLVAARDTHASFVFWGHASTAEPLARVVRAAADIDGDGAAPVWLGGADCAEGDSGRGPAQPEVPGDGVDQDCRGGDAPTVPPRTRRAAPWPGCRLPKEPMNVLLVIVDAWRADALRPEVMAQLSRYTTLAIAFDRAYSPSTMTFMSLPAILGGHYLSEGQQLLRGHVLSAHVPVAEPFRAAGWRTAVINPFRMLDAFKRGFSEVNPVVFEGFAHSVKGDVTAAGMTHGALEWIDRRRGQRWFLYVHYADLHAPYVDPRFGRTPDLEPYEKLAEYVDFHVGRLLEGLARRDLEASTIVAITSDHGEDLGRRGREGHGPDAFEDTIHVPLLLRVPGCPPARIAPPVSLTSLAPTLLLLNGLPPVGRSLLPSVDPEPERVPVVTEAYTTELRLRRAVVEPRWKLIVDVRNGGRMLFDLSADPGETRNLYRSMPAEAERMEALYQRWLDRPPSR